MKGRAALLDDRHHIITKQNAHTGVCNEAE